MMLLLCVALSGCALKTPVTIVVTATALPSTETKPPPTNTSAPPTNPFTPIPTSTPMPSPTRKPKWNAVPIIEIEEALRSDGYRRYPFTTNDGRSAFTWVKENNYQRLMTYEDGSFEIQILHDAAETNRMKMLEKRFSVLDQVFPEGFMDQLRDQNEEYNSSVPTNVSGEPERVSAYGDQWKTIWAEYEVEEMEIGSYSVHFSLWWWQSTCPSGYYCWYEDFPGLEFVGDSSFVFYTILLDPTD
jgi:hypothetical protein